MCEFCEENMILSERAFTATDLESATGIACITVFQTILIRVSAMIWKKI